VDKYLESSGNLLEIRNGPYRTNNNIIEQINKAKRYKWENDGKLIDQILVITSAKEEENPKLIEECKNKEIRVIFSEELKKLIFQSIIESIDLKEIFEEMLRD